MTSPSPFPPLEYLLALFGIALAISRAIAHRPARPRDTAPTPLEPEAHIRRMR